MKTPRDPLPGDDSRPGYEIVDLDSGGIGLVATMLVIGLLLASLAAALYYQALSIRTQRREGAILAPVPEERREFPPPRLQLRAPDDLAALRRREEAVLTHYGWIDREKGVVRIPIHRAMALLARRGLPVGTQTGPTWEEMMQQRAEQAPQEKQRSVP